MEATAAAAAPLDKANGPERLTDWGYCCRRYIWPGGYLWPGDLLGWALLHVNMIDYIDPLDIA